MTDQDKREYPNPAINGSFNYDLVDSESLDTTSDYGAQ